MGSKISLWGLYPYSAEASFIAPDAMSTSVPSVQQATEGSFAKGSFVSAAKSDNLTMSFYNLCGAIKFTLAKEGIKRVVLKVAGGKAVSGKVTIKLNEWGQPFVTSVDEACDSIVLTAGSSQMKTGTEYLFSALPAELSEGFTVTAYTNTQKGTFTTTNAVSIKRSVVSSIGKIDEKMVFTDLPYADDKIVFEDPIAKYACVQKYDTDGDGEISYAEAAAAKSFDGLFNDWKTVTSFEEMEYFTSIKSLPSGMFKSCTKLTHLTIPEFVTEIYYDVFYGCSALTSVIIPDGCKKIGYSCFSNCSSLLKIVLPKALTTIEQYLFLNCTSLSEVQIPDSVLFIGEQAFSGCSSLKIINLPPSLATIDKGAFYECSSLEEIIIPDSVVEMKGDTGHDWYGIFSGCTKLRRIVLSSKLTHISPKTFYYCTSLQDVSIKEGITSIHTSTFTGCNIKELRLPTSFVKFDGDAVINWCCDAYNIVLPANRMVYIPISCCISYVSNIYVPDHLVAVYKANDKWAGHKILPISDYREPVFNVIDIEGGNKKLVFNNNEYLLKKVCSGSYTVYSDVAQKIVERQVALTQDFWIAETETTNELYKTVMLTMDPNVTGLRVALSAIWSPIELSPAAAGPTLYWVKRKEPIPRLEGRSPGRPGFFYCPLGRADIFCIRFYSKRRHFETCCRDASIRMQA